MTPTELTVCISGAFLKTWFHLNNILHILLVIMGAAVKEGFTFSTFHPLYPLGRPCTFDSLNQIYVFCASKLFPATSMT